MIKIEFIMDNMKIIQFVTLFMIMNMIKIIKIDLKKKEKMMIIDM